MRRLVTLLLTAVLAGGCTARHPHADSGPSAAAGSRCGDIATTQITTADGVRLSAIDRGSGLRGVVFLPELGVRGMCGWTAYAQGLAADGYHVLLIDHRCTGASTCAASADRDGLMKDVTAAIDYLTAAGTQSVVLMGASQGATEALIMGATAPPQVAGIVALSADELTSPLAAPPFPTTGQAAAAHVRLPLLLAVAADDRYVTTAETRALAAAAPATDKQIVEVPGSAHGWDLLDQAASLNLKVRTFLDRVTRPRPDGCVPADASITDIALAGGSTITAVSMGTGPRVVILSNQSDENLCSWLDFTHQLTGAGYRVVLWDYANSAATSAEQLTALVAAERKSGARTVVLVGASKGAKTSLVAAATIRPAVNAVVSMSAEATLAPGIDVAKEMPAVISPVLIVTADNDPFGSASAAPTLLAAAGSAHKRLVRVPGSGHGTELLAGPAAPTVIPAVLAFIGGSAR
jgi:pimeloyl-ACP methyl ester carboxylesterase